MQQARDIRIGPSPSVDGVRFYTDSWAVIVGIQQYQDKSIPKLPGAVADANSVEQSLLKLGFSSGRIRKLIDADATRSRIERLFKKDLLATEADDRLLFFFAGHGATRQASRHNEGFLLPWDANQGSLVETCISMDEFRIMARRLNAKHVLLIADACYAGEFLSVSRSLDQPGADASRLPAYLKERSIEVITACTGEQRAWEEGGHGHLTRNFVCALEGEADEAGLGWVTAMQLAAWLQPRVIRDSDHRQHPQYGSLEGNGRFLFVLPPRSRVAAATVAAPVAVPAPVTVAGDPDRETRSSLKRAQDTLAWALKSTLSPKDRKLVEVSTRELERTEVALLKGDLPKLGPSGLRHHELELTQIARRSFDTTLTGLEERIAAGQKIRDVLQKTLGDRQKNLDDLSERYGWGSSFFLFLVMLAWPVFLILWLSDRYETPAWFRWRAALIEIFVWFCLTEAFIFELFGRAAQADPFAGIVLAAFWLKVAYRPWRRWRVRRAIGKLSRRLAERLNEIQVLEQQRAAARKLFSDFEAWSA